MRVERGREGIEEAGVELGGRHVDQLLEAPLVALDQPVLGFVERRVGGDVVRDLEVDQAELELVAVLGRDRIAALLGIDHDLDAGVDDVGGIADRRAHELRRGFVVPDHRLLELGEAGAVAFRQVVEDPAQRGAHRRLFRGQQQRPRGVEAAHVELDRAALDLLAALVEAHVVLEEPPHQIGDHVAAQVRLGRPGQEGHGGEGERKAEQRGEGLCRHVRWFGSATPYL